MAFVVDGSEWKFDGWSAGEVEDALVNLLERVQIARERHERVWVGDDLQTRDVLGGRTLWELWGPDATIRLPIELQHEMSAMLGMAHRYLDDEPWPEGIEHTSIAIDDELPTENTDVAWAHHHVRAHRAVACFGLRRAGVHPTRSDAGAVHVHWIVDERGQRAFFRDAIDVERDCEATLERLAPHAFPDLLFLPGVWRGLSDFDGGYDRVRADLRKHLSICDDYGKWIFEAPPPAERAAETQPGNVGSPGRRLIERRFALHALEVAPENPDVAADIKCRKERERILKGRTLYLEWHSKIEPHINRVHLHGPIPESDGKVVVGIMHAHLRLPGE